MYFQEKATKLKKKSTLAEQKVGDIHKKEEPPIQESSIPTLSDDSREASTGSEKANLLNDYFSKCFNSAVPPLSNVDVETLPQPL